MSTGQLFFEDVEPGFPVPPLKVGPITSAHLVRWCGASENWHKIHYDEKFSVEHDKLPGRLINGSFKQHFLIKLVKDWAGPQGWLWKIGFQFRAMNLVDENLTTWAVVTEKQRAEHFGIIRLELGIRNESGLESTPGKASVVLPYRLGKPLNYPFNPHDLGRLDDEFDLEASKDRNSR